MRIDYFPEEHRDALLHVRQLGRCSGSELLMPPELRVLDCYVIHFQLAGKTYYRDPLCGRCLVRPGDMVISYPERRHELNPLTGETIDLYFVAFHGPLADALFARLDMDAHAVFPATPAAAIAGPFSELLALARTGIPYHRDHADALLHALIVETLYQKNGAQLPAGHADPCARFYLFVQEHLADATFPLQQFLTREDISYEAFRKRFRRVAGQSPHSYWLTQKITHARQLLLRDIAIQEVAGALGFDDALYFSRLFKARTGMSPTQFRESARRFF